MPFHRSGWRDGTVDQEVWGLAVTDARTASLGQRVLGFGAGTTLTDSSVGCQVSARDNGTGMVDQQVVDSDAVRGGVDWNFDEFGERVLVSGYELEP